MYIKPPISHPSVIFRIILCTIVSRTYLRDKHKIYGPHLIFNVDSELNPSPYKNFVKHSVLSFGDKITPNPLKNSFNLSVIILKIFLQYLHSSTFFVWERVNFLCPVGPHPQARNWCPVL